MDTRQPTPPLTPPPLPSRRQALDSPAAVHELVRAFYARLLADPLMAPVFTEVAQVELERHLPRIEAFWRKMLLGERDYRRNMIARHERVHDRAAFTDAHFRRWREHFLATLEERFAGAGAERAARLATRIAGHMQHWLQEERPRRLSAPAGFSRLR